MATIALIDSASNISALKIIFFFSSQEKKGLVRKSDVAGGSMHLHQLYYLGS